METDLKNIETKILTNLIETIENVELGLDDTKSGETIIKQSFIKLIKEIRTNLQK